MAINDKAFFDGNGFLYAFQRFLNIFATKEELANAGGGDMLKSVYDKDDNGKVDDADKLGGQSPDYYMPASAKGQANGVASLGADGKVPEAQLPEMLPASHPHEMTDINGLPEAVAEFTQTLGEKASTEDLENAVADMTEIANGKCEPYVFDEVADLDADLTEYVAFLDDGTEMSAENQFKGKTLKTGDVFYIRAVNVPDYWWDGNEKKKQVLETTKVELTAISNEEIEEIIKSVLE